jgi:DhnA family fructose-bisphosphate aldolase class Ia
MVDGLVDRLAQILPGGKGVWVPMDHGISGYPEKGLEQMDEVVSSCISGGADAIVLQKGALSHYVDLTGWGNFVCHVSVSTVNAGPRDQYKVRVANAEECLIRGANAVSAQINLGDENEPEMIEDMGMLTSEAMALGLPTLGMIYPRGPHLKIAESDITRGVAHAARVAWELGCDIVKVPWTGDVESFKLVCQAVPIPVFISGGPRGISFNDLLQIVELSMLSGGSGVCIGRQVFGANDPESCIRALRAVVHDGATAVNASKLLER